VATRHYRWITFLATYVVTAGIVFYFGSRKPIEVLLAPLIVLSGWAFFGHLITIDDDLPGAWSNPEGSRTIWRASLLQLLVKGGIFALVTCLVVALLR
jgi:hypothetical protein